MLAKRFNFITITGLIITILSVWNWWGSGGLDGAEKFVMVVVGIVVTLVGFAKVLKIDDLGSKSKPWEIIVAFLMVIPLAAPFIWLMWPRTTDLIHSAEYKAISNKTFMTKTDLLLYRYGDSGHVTIEVPGERTPAIREIYHVPYHFENDKILKILPKGTRIKITRIKSEKIIATGIRTTVYARFVDQNIYKKEVDADFITDFSTNNRTMNSDYVEEIGTSFPEEIQ